MERRRLTTTAPQLALFTSAPAPGTTQPRRRLPAVAALAFDKAAALGYTDWSRDRPPSSGYWELKQRSAQAPDSGLWWYAPTIGAWHRGQPQRVGKDARFVPHAELMQAYEWRGVRLPWPEGYPYPLERAAFGAPVPLGNMAQAAHAIPGTAIVPATKTLPPFKDLNPKPSTPRRRIAP